MATIMSSNYAVLGLAMALEHADRALFQQGVEVVVASMTKLPAAAEPQAAAPAESAQFVAVA
jgi:hypothetical protein